MYDSVALQLISLLRVSLPNLNLDTKRDSLKFYKAPWWEPYSVLGDGGFTLAASGRPPRPVPASYSTSCPSLREEYAMFP